MYVAETRTFLSMHVKEGVVSPTRFQGGHTNAEFKLYLYSGNLSFPAVTPIMVQLTVEAGSDLMNICCIHLEIIQ